MLPPGTGLPGRPLAGDPRRVSPPGIRPAPRVRRRMPRVTVSARWPPLAPVARPPFEVARLRPLAFPDKGVEALVLQNTGDN
jgi:hypothetical protein